MEVQTCVHKEKSGLCVAVLSTVMCCVSGSDILMKTRGITVLSGNTCVEVKCWYVM